MSLNEDIEGCKMDITISMIDRTEGSDGSLSSQLNLRIDESETVQDLRHRLSSHLPKSDDIRLILAGQLLDNEQTLKSLDVGPSTVVHAIVSSAPPTSLHTSTPQERKDDHLHSSFFVFCKESSCSGLQRGKLRVYCSGCKSDAVTIQEEPRCWNDVLSRPHLASICLLNACQASYCEFSIKCTSCSSVGCPLSQIRGNFENEPCVTCSDVSSPILAFLPCSHVICLDCFKAYADISLNSRKFLMQPTHGYSLACPVSPCDGLVADAHHFRLLGTDYYQKFQSMAAETCVITDGGVFCPRPSCGAGFLLEVEARFILCPDCGHSFCRYCKNGASDCSCEGSVQLQASGETNPERLSQVTIKRVCRPCPKCKADTERNGGCHHMKCSQCGFPWCWVCGKQWDEDCQWDHWFQ